MASDAHDLDPIEPPQEKRRGWRGALILVVLAFALGAVAMGYALTHWGPARRYLAPDAPPSAPAPVAGLAAPQPVFPPDALAEAALDRRITGLEARLDRIDALANAAEGNADRAEGLLVAFAARRALDRGVQLGYIEALLRDRFGATQPHAVAMIIAAGRQPVTIDELQAGLSALAPALVSADPRESWWSALRRELGGLVIVRQRSTPSPIPADRLARARFQLEAGHVGAALAEVARLPGHDRAAAWIAGARRYAAAREALDVIETAALLAPHAALPAASAPTAKEEEGGEAKGAPAPPAAAPAKD